MMSIISKSVCQNTQDGELINEQIIVKFLGLPVFRYDYKKKMKGSRPKHIGFSSMAEINPTFDDEEEYDE